MKENKEKRKDMNKLILDIHERVIRIEEHVNNQSTNINKNTTKIDSIEPKVMGLTQWDKLKTITITLLAGLCGTLLGHILL